jgi:hypothetical protein
MFILSHSVFVSRAENFSNDETFVRLRGDKKHISASLRMHADTGIIILNTCYALGYLRILF